jgi:hypothetical protein
MPKLDLTPADTPEELENFIVYLLETSSRGSDEVSSFYDKFLNESKIELFVAETLDKLKVQAMNNMAPSFVEWQQNQRSKFKPSKIIPKE